MTIPPLDELARCEIDGNLVFLDLTGDRYFRLGPDANRKLLDELERSGRPRSRQPDWIACPGDWKPAKWQSDAIEEGRLRISEIARAVWTQRRFERRLASQALCTLLLELRSLREARCDDSPTESPQAAAIIRAFEQARLLRSAADRCLPRSLALCLCLAARHLPANLVFGVKLAPFGAHCWVQAGDCVLNDTVEEVRRYSPILIV